MTWDDLAEWAAFNRDFLDTVRRGHASGQTAEEIAQGWTIPTQYTGYDAPNQAGVARNIQVIIDELTAR